MNVSGTFPFGVCVWEEAEVHSSRTVSNSGYIHEILSHAGVGYSTITPDDLSDTLPGLKLLLTVGETTLSDDLAQKLRAWVRGGGAWVSIAGTCGLSELFGVDVEPSSYDLWGPSIGTLGEGYLKPQDNSHPVLAHLEIPLHYFNGTTVRVTDGVQLAGVLDAHQRPNERAAVVQSSPGDGRCLLIAPDVTGTVIRIQQGVAITRDGVPSSDGTGQTCDQALKTDDGRVLDWIFDREPVPGVPGLQAFLQPIADQWKELVLRSIFYLAREQGVALPVLWLYPRNLPALAHMSHDTDNNEPEKARQLLKTLETAGINSTWCVIRPGYSAEIIDAIREAGHELGMHYDALTDMLWSEEDFDAQRNELITLFGGEAPVSNKNHYLRWEGDTEFFEWCVRKGIRLDESKGPSKTGAAGYLFGTCHPHFPVDPSGNTLDVLELPTLTQDLEIFAPAALLYPLLSAALKSHGVLHLLFHPAHILTENVEEAVLTSIRKAREMGMEWWPACRINTWERARRQVAVSDYVETPENISIRIESPEPLEDASILWLAQQNGETSINGTERDSTLVNRFGFDFRSVTANIEKNSTCTLGITRSNI